MVEEFPLNVGYFRLARNVSKLSNCRTKVGCVLAKKTVLMACSNKEISHPDHVPGDDFRKSIHAEVRCLIHTSHENLEGAVVYVYRETKFGQPVLARPCERCRELLKEREVKKVFYTISDYPFYAWEKI